MQRRQLSKHELSHLNGCIALVGIQHTLRRRDNSIMIFLYINYLAV